ncbi:hypothetical protein K435DRAFT_797905 [Dendrothele bispora CBS 962.96]|uniref:Uncharacterized protein n=1 Tax=Dendrothele bispora (strain CBS 962.96) TaxID=1314807 RepID=A0A4S8M248_DENBC|nr:hypothetical protein K435DRAFT_797905 [Dendrothele bispora CBS 962.96]
MTKIGEKIGMHSMLLYEWVKSSDKSRGNNEAELKFIPSVRAKVLQDLLETPSSGIHVNRSPSNKNINESPGVHDFFDLVQGHIGQSQGGDNGADSEDKTGDIECHLLNRVECIYAGDAAVHVAVWDSTDFAVIPTKPPLFTRPTLGGLVLAYLESQGGSALYHELNRGVHHTVTVMAVQKTVFYAYELAVHIS